MKTFGSFTLVLLVILIVVGSIGATMYVSAMSPAWQERARELTKLEVQDQQNAIIEAAKRREDFTETLRYGALILLAVVVGVAAMLLWKQYDMRKESWERAVDGTFAIHRMSNGKQTWLVDPNKAVFGATGFNKLTGEIATDAQMVGPDRQLTYANNVQRTRSIAAKQVDGRKPSRNELLDNAGFFDNKARVEDARAQLAERRLLGSETPALDDGDLIALPNNWKPLTLVDAFSRSTPDRWLLGQNETGPCEFDIFSAVHTGLLGATKCGKTSSTALLMALNAAKHGMKVIALDGAGGVDWQPYADKFEVYDTDYTTIGDQLNQIIKLHDRRMKDLKLAGKPNIDELDYQIPSLFVVLEEFGRTMNSFKSANQKQYAATISALSDLMRVARKTGIYFLLIDQSMAGWDQLIKPNIKDYISYHLGAKQGNAFDAYDLHKLKPKGQFWNNGNVYDAWYTRGEVKPLLQKLPALRTKMLTDVEYSVIDTGIADSGVSTAPTYPDSNNTSTGTSNGITPVDNTVTPGTVANSTSIKKPLLDGKPVSSKDKKTVLNIYAMTKSINETCRLVWGGKTPSRMQWVSELVKGEQLQ